MVRAVEGTYENGKVVLDETAPGPSGTRVLVFFPNAARPTGDARAALVKSLFAQMSRGFDSGGRPYPKREELYDRFDR